MLYRGRGLVGGRQCRDAVDKVHMLSSVDARSSEQCELDRIAQLSLCVSIYIYPQKRSLAFSHAFGSSGGCHTHTGDDRGERAKSERGS